MEIRIPTIAEIVATMPFIGPWHWNEGADTAYRKKGWRKNPVPDTGKGGRRKQK